MTDRYITPSKITAWLDCAHFLTLKHQVEAGTLTLESTGMGSFAQLLADKGLAHEAECLAAYEAEGKRILRVPDRHERESFKAWTARIGDLLSEDVDVIYQMPFIHDGIRGIADFLVRSADGTWEPVDAKLARKEAKPGHVLQLCFYADAIAASTRRRPEQMHLWLGSGVVETLRVDDFAAYWRRLRGQLATVIDAPLTLADSRPLKCDHCDFCEFNQVCEAQWRDEDSLLYVAGLRSTDQALLEAGGVTTLALLAERVDAVEGLARERQSRVTGQAVLQLQARVEEPPKPPFVLVEPGEDPVWGHGFDQLPAPDDGDVFLDFEGHPFWTAASGLFFLFGLIERDDGGQWAYKTWWAHDLAQEGQRSLELIDHLAARRLAHPGMHVYHYNHTERSSLVRLAETHSVGEVTLSLLIDTGAFVDLLLVARNSMQVGAESYGLKALEQLTDYVRGHDIDQGAGAVLEYEEWMRTGTADALDRIASYNEDDVRATRALRDWMLGERPEDLPWRPAELEPDDWNPVLDEQVTALHAFGVGTVEHLLGDVLGYWRRENSAFFTPLRVRCSADQESLLADTEALAGLVCVGEVPRLGKNGNDLGTCMRFEVPEQVVEGFAAGDSVLFMSPEGTTGYSSVHALDLEVGHVDLKWDDKLVTLACRPSVIVRYKWVSPKPKPEAVSELAAAVLSGGGASPVAIALLHRDLPAFMAGQGPAGGTFTDDVDAMLGWASHLDQTVVAIQGPPGTGKTFRGSHLVRELIKAGKRVGITAMSHHAVDNLLEAVVDLFTEVGELDDLRAVKRGSAPSSGPLASVSYAAGNPAAAKAKFNLVAGTTWLFASKEMKDEPVDVLLVDEAGQLALADALAATRSARNLILLGDPLQLPQVALAVHPGGGGASVLEHILGDDITMPGQRGVFISETRRMHPDVCRFISDEIYEGRLTSHESCRQQTTAFGTGLRWLRAEHAGCTTSSVEEAEIVAAQIEALLGTPWTDQHGASTPLGVDDFLVVAPYNDQVDLLKARLAASDLARGVQVGTVDKFQGRQAAVVFYSMTASSVVDAPRGGDFLFSRNRFNVAVSRARCLAYLVCTEELLNSRGRDVDEMRLISTVCAFVERAELQASSEHLEDLGRRLALELAQWRVKSTGLEKFVSDRLLPLLLEAVPLVPDAPAGALGGSLYAGNFFLPLFIFLRWHLEGGAPHLPAHVVEQIATAMVDLIPQSWPVRQDVALGRQLVLAEMLQRGGADLAERVVDHARVRRPSALEGLLDETS